MKELKDEKLSYSSSTLLKNCEKRYFHYKVAKTAIDPDADDSTEAFDVGKSFHAVLEDTMHQEHKNLTEIVKNKCKENECEGEEAMVEAMVLKYLTPNSFSGLRSVKCEYEILTDNFIGYIDVVMVDKMGNWWIVDLKTAARVSPSLTSRLRHDAQLNLYGSFYQKVAKDLGLDPSKFKGMRYRVTTKTKLKRKTTESYEQFRDRIYSSIESYDIEIPFNSTIAKDITDDHYNLWKRSKQLHEGAVPTKNTTYCDSYFRPCPYWSQCYGDTYTECEKKLVVKTIESFKNDLKEL